MNPDHLRNLLAPLVAFGYNHATLKHANGVVLDIPGKRSYNTPASFRIIVLLKTISKILVCILTVRFNTLARPAGLLHPNQCGSLPGLSTSDAVATLTHEVGILQRLLLQVSTLFLNKKAGFDNVNATKLQALLLSKNIPTYMVPGSPLSSREGNALFSSKAPLTYQPWSR